MRKISAVLLSALFILTALCACTPAEPVTTADSGTQTEKETETETVTETEAVTEPETEPAYPADMDNYAGTPAYTVDGDKIIVDGVAYPNNNNMKNGITYAVDDLGREVRLTGEAYNTEKHVGIFYFLWMGEHGDNGALDMTKIMEEGGEDAKKSSYKGWGPVGAMHFWGEPLFGYYYSSDKWVIRKHMEELTLAEIDFLYFDVTNAVPYLSNAAAVMKTIQKMYDEGFNPPKVVFYTHTQSAATVRDIYNGIYKKEAYPDAWFYLDGKPLIIAYEDDCKNLSASVYEFFTYREAQWPNEPQKRNGWPWMDFTRPQRVFKNKNNEKEAINVSVAQHSGTVCFSDSAYYGDRKNRGRSFHNKKNDDSEGAVLYGYNFQEQWDRAVKADVPYVLVTGWNEWVAQRQDPNQLGRPGQVVFVDTASMEFSRDIEPMRGGYFDNYYMQLIDNIRRYKGVAPTLVQDTRKIIDLDGGFEQWDDILVTYSDPTGDNADRGSRVFGNKTVKDNSGNNDIRYAKVTQDRKYLYFYIDVPETVDDEPNVISEYVADTSWMQIFINTDMNAETGFYGFDYIINDTVKDDKTSTLAKAKTNGKEFSFEYSSDIEYRVKDNKMMIKVPLEALGITDYSKIQFAFKIVDSDTKITTMEQMYSEGDCAPIGRLSYVFQNCK
ncbi:MAG: hypothetical protein IJS94_06305 [Clostridia bacterium]|nr:hypothetical protein [Clostridia bacterium]